MPPGVPVATVAINGAKNAALLAVQILARSDEELNQKQKEYRQEMKEKVLATAEKLEDQGYQEYLERSEKFAD
jgi:5-(carboxyamino)imidazole ribonucleotide mutase